MVKIYDQELKMKMMIVAAIAAYECGQIANLN